MQLFTLEDNFMAGTIPATLARLSALFILLLENNYFTGHCDNIVDPSTQLDLTTVQLSNNQLTGPFPTSIFQLPRLETFGSVSNCFDNSLTDALCQATQLRTLAADGMRSSVNCQVKILPVISPAKLIQPGHR